MSKSHLHQLAELGQSVWVDHLSRDLVHEGELARMMREDAVVGVTSNPTIFQKAISQGTAYDDQLRELYGAAGLDPGKQTIAYCRIGERSAHTWFVLYELLGQTSVRNYDGSWTEYGALVGVPITIGDNPGGPEGGVA